MLIYKITNLINQKIYIGQSSKNNKEFQKYWGTGLLIKRAIKKYGIENFKKEIIKDNIRSKTQLNKFEKVSLKN
jgi:hypothetical protein